MQVVFVATAATLSPHTEAGRIRATAGRCVAFHGQLCSGSDFAVSSSERFGPQHRHPVLDLRSWTSLNLVQVPGTEASTLFD